MKKILLIAYFYGTDGSAMSEYVRDRIIGFEMNGYTVDLVTSINVNNKYRRKNTIYVPSFGLTMFLREMKASKHYFAIRKLILFPIVLTFGTLVDLTERAILKRIGDGYWSWMPFATIAVFLKRIFNRYELIISTGGPASAHLINVLSSVVFKTKGIVELQDPLVGNGIGHNDISNSLLNRFELFIYKRVRMVMHISQNALEMSLTNNKDNNKYAYYYPSSPKFNLSERKSNQDKKSITIVHIGSIYSTRNFNTLKNVIDNLNLSLYNITGITLANVGSISDKDCIRFKADYNRFLTVKEMPRIQALQYGKNSDLLILLQHEDDRSKISFPYKIWDYLNLQLPILAILNNNELKNMLDAMGHYTCNVNNPHSIETTFRRFLGDYSSGLKKKNSTYEIELQTLEFINKTNH